MARTKTPNSSRPVIPQSSLLSGLDLDHAATDLVQLDGVEQGLEVALAERLVALALDDLEENRAEQVAGEYLQQEAVLLRAVDQDAVLAHPLHILAVARQAAVDQLEIGVDGVLEFPAALAQLLEGLEDVVGGQGQVLDALAVVLAQELLDLGVLVLALVQRDADGLVGRDHRLAEQAGRLALDVEVLLLGEAEHPRIEARPGPHLAAAYIVGEVVEHIEADRIALLRLRRTGDLLPADIERDLRAVPVDQIEHAAAAALQHIG